MIGQDGLSWIRRRCRELLSDPNATWSNQRVKDLLDYIDDVEGKLSRELAKNTAIENVRFISEQRINKLEEKVRQLLNQLKEKESDKELLQLRSEVERLKKQLKENTSTPIRNQDNSRSRKKKR